MHEYAQRLDELSELGLRRRLRLISGPQGPRVLLDGNRVKSEPDFDREMAELLDLVRRKGLPPIPVSTRPLEEVTAALDGTLYPNLIYWIGDGVARNDATDNPLDMTPSAL